MVRKRERKICVWIRSGEVSWLEERALGDVWVRSSSATPELFGECPMAAGGSCSPRQRTLPVYEDEYTIAENQCHRSPKDLTSFQPSPKYLKHLGTLPRLFTAKKNLKSKEVKFYVVGSHTFFLVIQ